jgi:hypothetical protein
VTERLIEIGRWLWNGNECGKTTVMRVLRQSLPIQIMIDQKLLGNGNYFNYLGSMITSGARCRWEIKSRISMENAFFNKKKTLYQQVGLKFKEETSRVPHLEYSFIK